MIGMSEGIKPRLNLLERETGYANARPRLSSPSASVPVWSPHSPSHSLVEKFERRDFVQSATTFVHEYIHNHHNK